MNTPRHLYTSAMIYHYRSINRFKSGLQLNTIRNNGCVNAKLASARKEIYYFAGLHRFDMENMDGMAIQKPSASRKFFPNLFRSGNENCKNKEIDIHVEEKLTD